MNLLVFSVLTSIACAYSQHLSHYAGHGGHDYLDSSHAVKKHGHHGALEEYGDEGHSKHGHYEQAGHKAHSGKVAHHDSHDKHHDKGYFERNKGHGYEKSYAYDHIKSHHDKGSSHDAYGYQQAHHGIEGGHKLVDDKSHGYAKHGKKSQHGGHGYSNVGKVLAKHGGYHRSHDTRQHQEPIPVVSHYSYAPVAHSAPVIYSGPEHHGYIH